MNCETCGKLKRQVEELEETLNVMNSIPGVKVAIQRWKLRIQSEVK